MKAPVNGIDSEHALQELRRIRNELRDAGLFTTPRGVYIRLALALAGLWMGVWACALGGWVVPGALLLSLFWQQAAFIGHDAGHGAVTHGSRADTRIGLVVTAFLGIGTSWWKATHNVHHTVVNSVDCDPDIQVLSSARTSKPEA